MPIAAVPSYLGKDFRACSPALRFGLLLPNWTAREDQEREVLTPYGLPYLPGSGVKGVLRQAARELVSGEWGDARGWSTEPVCPLQVDGKPVLDGRDRPVKLSVIEGLFGRETPSGESGHVRGTLAFWDVIPQIPGDSLMVEVMTPHQGHYYQEKAEAGSIDPHESGHPIPIGFLTVPPGSRFVFHVECDLVRLERLAPDLAAEGRWKVLLEAAFRHAFAWLGFGAKTAVGYGHMQVAADRAPAPPGVVAGGAGPGPALRPEIAQWSNVVLKLAPGRGELTVSHQGKTANATGQAAGRLRAGRRRARAGDGQGLVRAEEGTDERRDKIRSSDISLPSLSLSWAPASGPTRASAWRSRRTASAIALRRMALAQAEVAHDGEGLPGERGARPDEGRGAAVPGAGGPREGDRRGERRRPRGRCVREGL
jgi:CRISPR type III-B/RAMP module RAMP protein Cmr6